MSILDEIINVENEKIISLEKLKKSDLPTYMYGSGSYAKDVTLFLGKHGIEVEGYGIDGEYLEEKHKFLKKDVEDINKIFQAKKNFNIVIGFNDFIKARERLQKYNKQTNIYFFDAPHRLSFFDYEYIKRNQKNFQQSYDWLEDKLSKDVFVAFINSKISSDPTPLYRLAEPNQYFTYPVNLTDNEVFIDCGAYDGDTVRSFVANTQGKYKKIIAIEPDLVNYKKLNNYVLRSNIKDIHTVNIGTWSKNDRMRFTSEGNMTTADNEKGIDIVVNAIDNIPEAHDTTFIKMDIEGSELESLRGARRTIKKQLPILAICIYHKPEDLIEIPQYIKSLHKGYKLYLRQHQLISWETVLYAIPEYR